jgi:putative aminopeptidase FrvX
MVQRPVIMNELLKRLTEASGVSGFETEVRTLIRDLILDHVDEWHVDAIGNLIAIKRGNGDTNLKVMLDAHMDEVGLLITGADGNGTLKFATVGGLNSQALAGKVVKVGSSDLTGVIGLKPVHLLTRSQIQAKMRTAALRIDIGAKSKDEAARKAKPGTPVTFMTPYEELGEVAIGKAFDDRAGCAALISILQGDRYDFDLIAVFSAQEEVGLRGAGVAAFGAKPDMAFVLECTPAYDLPNKREVSPNVALGKGPAIYVMDRVTIQDPRLVSTLVNTADSNHIPFQIRQPGGGGTNTAAIQRSRGGVPAATISTPARYIHGPISMINLGDFQNVVRLVDLSLRSLNKDSLSRKN